MDHEKNVREKAQALHDAIREAEGAGYRITYPGNLRDLPAIAISETAAVSAPQPGDEFNSMSKDSLRDLAVARGLTVPSRAGKDEIIALLKANPAPIA